jgi:hypothetical protein
MQLRWVGAAQLKVWIGRVTPTNALSLRVYLPIIENCDSKVRAHKMCSKTEIIM